jgi:hypothetical protein
LGAVDPQAGGVKWAAPAPKPAEDAPEEAPKPDTAEDEADPDEGFEVVSPELTGVVVADVTLFPTFSGLLNSKSCGENK